MDEIEAPAELAHRKPGTSDPEDQPQVVNLNTTSVEVVDAELVRMHQSAAREITSDEVELHQSGAFDVTTVELNAHEAAIGFVTAGEVEMTNSAAGGIRAEHVNLTGQAGVIMAGSTNLGNTYAGLGAGRDVRGERIESLILLAGNVEGDVSTVIDTRGALLAGVAGGFIAGLVLLVGRFIFRRES
jgi:hypothetical protein